MSENNKDVLLPLPPEEDDGMLIGSVVNGDLYKLILLRLVLVDRLCQFLFLDTPNLQHLCNLLLSILLLLFWSLTWRSLMI